MSGTITWIRRWDGIYGSSLQHFHLFWHRKMFVLCCRQSPEERKTPSALARPPATVDSGCWCHLPLSCVLLAEATSISNPTSSTEKGGFLDNRGRAIPSQHWALTWPHPEFSHTGVCLSAPDSGGIPATAQREVQLGGGTLQKMSRLALPHQEHPTGNLLPSVAHHSSPPRDMLLPG